MRDLSCEEVVERIPALVVGDLSPDQESLIDQHIATCRECAIEVGQGRALAHLLDELQEDSQRPPRPELGRRLMEALPAEASYDCIETSIGPIFLVAGDGGLNRVAIRTDEDETVAWIKRRGLRPEHNPAELRPYASQFREYFAGERRDFDVPFNLHGVSPFTHRVLDALLDIPYGHLASYRDLAVAVGSPRATQAVGNAVGSNPLPIIIPCHRIIRSDGSIGGYGPGVDAKWVLLELEGATLPTGSMRA